MDDTAPIGAVQAPMAAARLLDPPSLAPRNLDHRLHVLARGHAPDHSHRRSPRRQGRAHAYPSEMTRMVDDFRCLYNHVRPHETLNGDRPIERYLADPDKPRETDPNTTAPTRQSVQIP
jgi:transposase InsO family protein